MDTIIDTRNRIDETVGLDPSVEKLVGAVEALLFAAHEPLAPTTLLSLNGHSGWTLDEVVAEINRRMELGSHPMRVRKVAGGYQMFVLPEYGPIIESILVKTKTQRLSRAGLETLAIIAYRQPSSIPEIEHIRGVAADAPVRTLLERGLITIKGRSEGPGRPLLYGTTDEFLHYFGLNTLDELPREDELAALLAARNEQKMREHAEDDSREGAHSLTLRLSEDNLKLEPYDGFHVRNVITTLSENLSN